MTDRPRILFLCTANACRSQIAQGLLEVLAPDRYESLSAGIRPAGFVHEFAQIVVEEVGGQLHSSWSKPVEDFRDTPPDLIIALCDRAARELRRDLLRCPVLHWPLPDPISVRGNAEARIAAFRWVRDHIRERIEDALATEAFERAIEQGVARPSLLRRVLARYGSR